MRFFCYDPMYWNKSLDHKNNKTNNIRPKNTKINNLPPLQSVCAVRDFSVT